jgi:uncharacterized protein (TIGR02266 family)
MARTSEHPSDTFEPFRRSFDDEDQPVSLVHPKGRSVERTTLDVEVSLDSESHFFVDLSGDVSEGGLFVATYRVLERGTVVLLRFCIFGETLEVDGVVRWRRPAMDDLATPGVGVSFRDLPAKARTLIESFCQRRPAFYHDVVGSPDERNQD